MNKVRNQIYLDYNGKYESDEEVFQALEYPIGDLFDDDTYWLDTEDAQ